MKYALKIAQINQNDKQLVGNKAFNLNRLNNHRFQVAPFFVVTTDTFDEIVINKVIHKFLHKINSINLDNIEKNGKCLQKLLKQINSIIDQISFPMVLESQIIENLESISSPKVAVRSSATCEDGANSSFAGQFNSLLSIGKRDVFTAIKQIWQSVFTEQVISYCIYHQINFNQIKMAVVIQQMIDAQKGGVIFTQDIFCDEDRLVIEVASGLGENVVSGLTNSQKLVFTKNTGKCIEGRIGLEKPVLTNEEAKELFTIGLKIEKLYGHPQDIEWAIEKGKIYILQTRPITS